MICAFINEIGHHCLNLDARDLLGYANDKDAEDDGEVMANRARLLDLLTDEEKSDDEERSTKTKRRTMTKQKGKRRIEDLCTEERHEQQQSIVTREDETIERCIHSFMNQIAPLPTVSHILLLVIS